MPILLILAAIVIALGILVLIIKLHDKGKNIDNIGNPADDISDMGASYYLKPYTLEKDDYSFLGVLKHVIPDKDIFPKVRMLDVIGVDGEKDRSRVRKKNIDFIVSNKNKTLLAIELDDSSHNDREKNAIRDHIFKTAGLPYLIIPYQKRYDTQKLKIMIDDKLKSSTAMAD